MCIRDRPREERLYLGGYEVYRKHAGADAGLERRTLHVMDCLLYTSRCV